VFSARLSSALIAANYGFFSDEYGLTRGFDRVFSCPRNLIRHEALLAPVARRVPGVDHWFGHLFRTPFDARAILERATQAVSSRGPGPLFLLVNLMDAHPPTFAEVEARRYPEVAAPSAERHPGVRAYDLAIRRMDTEIGRFLDGLEAAGLFDGATIVITSDHGETFWGGRSAHASTLLPSETRIPLLVKAPGQRAAREVAEPTQLSDVARMIAEAFGVPEAAAPSSLPDGVAVLENYLSLPRGSGPEIVRVTTVDRERPTHLAIVENGWQLIANPGAAPTLLRVPSDRPPGASADAVAELLPPDAFELDVLEDVATPDPEVLERLRALGYIQ